MPRIISRIIDQYDFSGPPISGQYLKYDSASGVFRTAPISVTGVVSNITSNNGSVAVVTSGTNVDLSVTVAAATNNVIVQVRNTTGSTLTKGTVVYINNATGQIPTVAKALATSDVTSAQTLGMISADISNNGVGYVTIIGLIDDIDTNAYQDGDQLYLSGTTAGTFTKVKPYAPTHLVYVGVVEYAHQNHGKIFVKVQNGYELDEIHDVSARYPSSGQTIVYNSASGLWQNSLLSLTSGVTGVLPVANGGTNSSSLGTSGNILYFDGSQIKGQNSLFYNTGSFFSNYISSLNATGTSQGSDLSLRASNASVSGKGGSLFLYGGSGVGVGAGGNVVITPGSQGSSGGDGKLIVNSNAIINGVTAGINANKTDIIFGKNVIDNAYATSNNILIGKDIDGSLISECIIIGNSVSGEVFNSIVIGNNQTLGENDSIFIGNIDSTSCFIASEYLSLCPNYNVNNISITTGGNTNGVARNLNIFGGSQGVGAVTGAGSLILQGGTDYTPSGNHGKVIVKSVSATGNTNLLEWQNSSGVSLAYIDASGKLYNNNILALPVTSGVGNDINITAGSGVTSGSGGSVILKAGLKATTGSDGKVIVKQNASQTSNIFEVQASDGTAAISVSSANPSVITISDRGGADLIVGANQIQINRNNASPVYFHNAAAAGQSSVDIRSANLLCGGYSTSNIPLIVRSASGQTANLQEWRNNSGTALISASANGNLTIGTTGTNQRLIVQGGTNAQATEPAFVVKNAAGSNILFVDTKRSEVAIGSALYFGQGNATTAYLTTDSQGGFSWVSAVTTAPDINYVFAVGTSSNITKSGGTTSYIGGILSGCKFYPTSGTSAYASFVAGSAINQTSTASGTVRGLYVNDNLISVLGTYRAIETTYGNVLINTGNAAYKGLIIQAAASQTANLQELQNSSGTPLTYIDATGRLYNNNILALPVASGSGNSITLAAGSGVTSGAGGSLILKAGIQATTGGDGTVAIQQVSGQTSNLFETINTTGAKLFQISNNGQVASFTSDSSSSPGNRWTGTITFNPNLFGTDVPGFAFSNTHSSFGSRGGISANGVSLNAGTITASWNGPSAATMLNLNRNGSARYSIYDDVILNNNIYFYIGTSTTTAIFQNQKSIVFRAPVSTTGNIQEWQNSSSGILASVGPSGAISLLPYGTGLGNTNELRFLELAANGTEYVGFKGANVIPSSIVWTLPSGEGASGQALTTNGSGLLSWANSSTGTVTSISGTGTVNGLTLTGTVTSSGAITLGGTLSNVSLISAVTDTLPIANGGTNAITATGALANLGGVSSSDSRLSDSRTPSGTAGGDLTGTYPNPTLGAVGSSGIYTKVTTDTKGRVISGTTLSVSDIPTLNQNTTGTANNVTGIVAIINGGTNATTATGALANLGAVATSDTRLSDSRTPSGSAGGDLTGSYPNPTLATVGSSGVYTKITTDTKGRVISGTTLLASDIPTLNQNTTGTANNVTGIVAIANGGTNATSLGSSGNILYFDGTRIQAQTLLNYTASGIRAISPSTTGKPLIIQGVTGQTANLQEWQNVSGTALSYLDASGNFYAVSKSFLIPHPSPEKAAVGRKLRYASLEGPEHAVFFRGNLCNSNQIDLPNYWKDLVHADSITVSITPKKYAQPNLFIEEADNIKIIIDSDRPINCDYIVYGTRKDVEKLEVETDVC